MPEENQTSEPPTTPEPTPVIESAPITPSETVAPTASVETVDPRVAPEDTAGSPEDDSKKLGGDENGVPETLYVC